MLGRRHYQHPIRTKRKAATCCPQPVYPVAIGAPGPFGHGRVLIPEVNQHRYAAVGPAFLSRGVDELPVRQPLRQFGVYDADHNYFVRLPTEWQDNMTISAQSERLADTVKETTTCCARCVADHAAASSTCLYTGSAAGRKEVLACISAKSCTAVQANLIRRGVAVLG